MTKSQEVQDLERLSDQIAQLNQGAAAQRQQATNVRSPEFESNVRRCREVWEVKGAPALKDLSDLARTMRSDFENAAQMDFEALARSGVDRGKWLSPLVGVAERAIYLFNRGPEQLEGALAKIEFMSPETEAARKHGCKLSDEILYEINAAVGLPDELRAMHTKLKFLIEGTLAAHKRLTGGPDDGAN